MASKRIRGITIEIGGNTTKLEQSLSKVEKNGRSLGQELSKVNKFLKFDPKNTEILSQKQQILKERVENTAEQLKILEEAQKSVKEQYKNGEIDNGTYRAFQREIQYTKSQLKKFTEESENFSKSLESGTQDAGEDVKKLNSKLKDTSKNLDDATEKAEKFSSEGFSSLEKGAKVLAGAFATATGGAVALIKKSTDIGLSFESQMSKVQALSGASGDEFAKLEEKAKNIGATTKFTAEQAGQGLEYMALAGWKTEDMLNGLDGIINAAAASGEDLAKVSDIITDGLTAFGLSANDSTKFADVLATASANSNTTISLLGESFKNCAATAGAMGYSFEDVTTALGLMANAGIKGSNSGTSLNSIMTRLAKPTAEVKQALSDLNIEAVNSDGSMKQLSELIPELQEKFSSLTEKEKGQYATMIAGKTAMSGFLTIVNASKSDFDKLSGAINSSNGAAQKMSSTMNDNLKGDMTILGSSLEGLGLQVYDELEKPLRNAAKSGQKAVSTLSKTLSTPKMKSSLKIIGEGIESLAEGGANLAEKVLPKLVDMLAFAVDNGKELATATGAVVLAMKGMQIGTTVTSVIKGVTGAQATLNAVMSANPIGAVVTAVGALIAAYNFLSSVYESTEEKVEKGTKATRDNLEAIKDETQAYQDLKKEREEALNTDLAQIEKTQSLWKELQNLCDENGNVKKGYEDRVNFIKEHLEEALGIEIALNGDIIQNYKDIQKEIDNLLIKKKGETIVASEEEAYKNALTNKTATETELNSLKKQESDFWSEEQDLGNGIKMTNTDIIRKYKEAIYQMQNGHLSHEKYASYQQTERELEVTYKIISENLDNINNSIEEKTELLNGYYSDIAIYETDQARLLSGNVEEIEKINSRFANSYIKDGERVEINSKAQADNFYNHWKWLQSEYQKGSADVSKEMMDAAYNAWKEAEKAAQASISTVVSTVKDGTNQAGKAVEDSVDKIGKNIRNKSEDIGRNFSKGIAAGIHAEQKNLDEAAGSSIQGVFKRAKAVAVIESPSKRARDEIGKYLPLGVAEGIKEATPKALDAMKDSIDNLFSVSDRDYQHKQMQGASNAFNSLYNYVSTPQNPQNSQNTQNETLNLIFQLMSEFKSEISSIKGKIDKLSKRNVYIDGNTLLGYVDEGLGGMI